MRVADFHGDLERLIRRAVPQTVVDREFVRHQILRLADDHAARGGVDVDDIHRARRTARQPFALADGEHFDALVLGHAIARFVVNAAGVKLTRAEVRSQERLVVVPRHETDLLAVHFVRRLQAELPRDGADFRLLHPAERRERARELRLPEAEQKIRLIFPRIAPFAQHRPVTVMLDDRVVPRGDVVRAERLRLAPQVAKFHLLVAHHARVRRAPVFVLVGEIVDDQPLEVFPLVDDVMRHAQRVRHAPRIGDRLRPAALILRPRDAVLRPHLHRHADDLVALLLQQPRRHAGIHAPTHAHDHAPASGGSGVGGGRWRVGVHSGAHLPPVPRPAQPNSHAPLVPGRD